MVSPIQANSPHLLELPEEVLTNVLTRLPYSDVMSVHLVNRQLAGVAKDNQIWKGLLAPHGHGTPPARTDYFRSMPLGAHRMLSGLLQGKSMPQQAVKKFSNSRPLILEATKQDYRAIRNASPRLQRDREILLAAIKNDIWCVPDDCPWLADAAFMLEALALNPGMAKIFATHPLCDALRTDPTFCRKAVRVNGMALQGVPQNACDRDMVIDAIKQNAWALQYAPARYRNERAVVLLAVRKSASTIVYASARLRDDRALAFELVKSNPFTLEHFSDRLRDDRDLVSEAVNIDAWTLLQASPRLQADQKLQLKAIKKDPRMLANACRAIRCDRDVVLDVIKRDGMALGLAPKALRSYRELVLAAVEQNGMALEFASNELKRDPEVVRRAVQNDSRAIYFAIAASAQFDVTDVMANSTPGYAKEDAFWTIQYQGVRPYGYNLPDDALG